MVRYVLVLAMLLSVVSTARAEPANSIQQLWGQLNECLATVRLTKGTDITLQFSLNRRGGLIGKPRMTHIVWGPNSDSKADAASIAEGFDHCLPASITDALGGAIAGRQIAYRLQGAHEDKS